MAVGQNRRKKTAFCLQKDSGGEREVSVEEMGIEEEGETADKFHKGNIKRKTPPSFSLEQISQRKRSNVAGKIVGPSRSRKKSGCEKKRHLSRKRD